MNAPRFAVRSDGRTLRSLPAPAPKMRPVTCPPPTSNADVYAAAQELMANAYLETWGVRTQEGTCEHQAAVRLEAARLFAYVTPVEGEPLWHVWELTDEGRFEWERRQREGTRYDYETAT